MLVFRVLFCSLATTQAFRLAQPVPQPDISKRVTYNGGWALGLSGSSCPSDAPVACSTQSGSVNPMCCPSGQTCSGDIRPYCCPTSVDCSNVVENVPVCANSTWNMYTQGGGNYFCCEPDQFGVLPLHGYAGICEPLDQTVASSLIATPASQVGGAAVTSVATETGGGGAANTMTVTSTLQNGGVTTITTAISGTATQTQGSASATGTGLNTPKGGGTATITLSRGAEIGIAIGAALVLIVGAIVLWRCVRAKKGRQTKMNNEGYAYQSGPAPMYSAVPNQGMQQQQQPYVVSPVQEYKTPVVGVMPQYGSPTPSPGSAGGYASPNSSPPPQFHQQQQQYGSSPQMQGRYEAPGGPVSPPVEAPNAWERGIDG
ncbi:uncharacterized protein LY89DRAFT_789672 [Mollisia scopiformis]|uniref:Mid2 domain-containing protein n=1 Tax=Mollisia scopiformis TaxID=149040 RepID=A0A132B7E8_MOLSC|nr:uncharacterized protein LY89DRAFT_789672 [Mollisia scopiformis]KUJ07607.1 hypothetical protein LY89DRAFT_789672 [Mollisia scopiformis]